jgi:hypothetical protein
VLRASAKREPPTADHESAFVETGGRSSFVAHSRSSSYGEHANGEIPPVSAEA